MKALKLWTVEEGTVQWWSVLRSLHGRVRSGLREAGAHVNESTTAAGPSTLPHSPLPSWNMAAEAESP